MSKHDGTTILGGRWLFIITEKKGFRSTSKFPVTKKQSKTIKRNKEHCLVKEPVESPSSLERCTIYLFTSYLEQKKERKSVECINDFCSKNEGNKFVLFCATSLQQGGIWVHERYAYMDHKDPIR